MLYLKRVRDVDSAVPKWASVSLMFTRFLAVSFLCVLLLSPLLKYLERLIEKPAVFLAIDNSESMVLGGDSTYVKNQFRADVEKLKTGLADKYDVVELGIGENDNLDFNKKQTDLSALFSEKNKLYSSRNTAAMVLVSDGIYNRGTSPGFSAQRLGAPVYTIALGDTTVRQDVSIYSAKANAITFLGNQFPIEVVVNANKAAGKTVELSLWKGANMLGAKSFAVSGDRFTATHTFLVEAKAQGTQGYTVRVTKLQEELNKANNQKSVYTEVLDARQKILVLAHAPHPDIAALRTAIEASDQYEMTLEIGNFSPIKKEDYDLVITHQFPVDSREFNILQNIKESRLPVFSFIGASTDISLFNRLEMGVQIAGNRNNVNQALALPNSQFNLFIPDKGLTDFLNEVPPLTVPFGEYSNPDVMNVLMYQKIGNVGTEIPLWFFSKNELYRSGVACGEGIWRWKLYDYEQNENHDYLSELIQKTIQYLALKDDKRKFRVYTSSRSLNENEAITFVAEVYNESYEFTPDADVKIDLKHENGDTYSYNLLASNNAYMYKVGALPPGKYTFVATSQQGGELEKVNGEFVVKELRLEQINLTANHGLLNQVAQESGGKMYAKTDWESLQNHLMELPNSSSVSRTNHRYKELISQKWLFFVLFLLLGVEWFARRWFGTY